MLRTPTPPPAPPGNPLRAAAGVLLAAGGVLASVVLFADAAGSGEAPVPFVWADAAAVAVACAVPLAAWLAVGLTRRAGDGVALAAGMLAAGAAVAVLLAGGTGTGPGERAALALGLAFGFAAPAVLLLDRPAAMLSPLAAAVGVAVWLVPPEIYLAARSRADAARLGELVGEGRVGEARTLARNMLLLDPAGAWNGRPLRDAVAGLDRAAADLESRAAAPLPPAPTPVAVVDRARLLAMLGRTDDALGLLAGVPDSADADALRGTVHEARGEWEEGRRAFAQAREAWERAPPGPARDAGLVRAVTGVAYCERKLGRYADAAAAYQELLALAPTADTHFLLGRFYEDAQQAGPARDHARAAAALDPVRYGRPAGELVRKLSVYQFGCLGVWRAGKSPPGE